MCAILLSVSGVANAQDSDEQTRIFFINAKGEDGKNIGVKRIVATKEEWDQQIRPNLAEALEQEFGASQYTYRSVSAGTCFVFSRRVDDEEGVMLFLDYRDSLEDAKARAKDLKTNSHRPRTVVETGCHDGSGGGSSASESSFNCGDGSNTVSMRMNSANSDVLILSGSSGQTGKLTLVTERRKIDRLDAELKQLKEQHPELLVSGPEGPASPREKEAQALEQQLEQAFEDYRQKFIEGIKGMCPEKLTSDPSWYGQARQWTFKWIEKSRGCSYSVPPNDPKYCEYNPFSREKATGGLR